MGLMARHAGMIAPMQAATEISLGILLVIGLLTRPAAFVAFLFLTSLWVSEWGTSWIWELLVPVLASLGIAVGRAGRAWGIDGLLAGGAPRPRGDDEGICVQWQSSFPPIRSRRLLAPRATISLPF